MKTLYVIKIGGNIIDDDAALEKFLTDFAQLSQPKILVHGGGKIATKIAEKLEIVTQMVDGRRITDLPMLEVVTMVYGGLINKNIVARLQSKSVNALGITGADGNACLSDKRPVKEIDYGYVGDVKKVNASFLYQLLEQGIVPIFAPLTHDGSGNLLNTNADTMANEIALALATLVETHLIYCFELKGVLQNFEDKNSVIPFITPRSFNDLKNNGIISKGMIPKLENAIAAIKGGVSSVTIAHAEDIHMLKEGKTLGTKIIHE